MSESENLHNTPTQGEAVSPNLSFRWVNPGLIDAGEFIMPAKLTSQAARVFAALHLILGDLTFAEECLTAANEIGVPNDQSLHSKALIFSGVVSYARCFKSGVRALSLSPDDLHSKGAAFDDEIHEYLIALRDKHVAHSVNDFEQCEAIAIVVGKPEVGWRDGGAIGVVKQQSIGVSRALVQQAVAHIKALRDFLEAGLDDQRTKLYADFQANFEKTGEWEIAPIVKLSDRSKVAERRR